MSLTDQAAPAPQGAAEAPQDAAEDAGARDLLLRLGVVASPGWMSRGACRGEDPELFFPIAAAGAAQRQITVAKAVCHRCLVRPLCWSYAVETSQDGIWGGTTSEERARARADARGTPATSGSGFAQQHLRVRAASSDSPGPRR